MDADLRACELFSAGGFGGGNENLWCVSGLTSKVIGKGFISGLSAFAALAGDRASDIRAASTGQRGPTQQVVGDGHE